MTTKANPPIVIPSNQNRDSLARHAAMRATQVTGTVAALQPFKLDDIDQRNALVEMVEKAGYVLELPPRADCAGVVVYPVVVNAPDGKKIPIIFHDTEVPAAMVVAAACTGGLAAAQQLNYRAGLLPAEEIEVYTKKARGGRK